MLWWFPHNSPHLHKHSCEYREGTLCTGRPTSGNKFSLPAHAPVEEEIFMNMYVFMNMSEDSYLLAKVFVKLYFFLILIR